MHCDDARLLSPSQVVSMVLFVFAVSYPLIAASKASGEQAEGVRVVWLAPLLSFFTVLTYFAFHEACCFTETLSRFGPWPC